MNTEHVADALADLWPSYPWSRLTKRQMEVAELVVNGHSREEIEAALAIATKTVEAHLSDIRRRLGLLPNRRPLTSVLLADLVRRQVGKYEDAS